MQSKEKNEKPDAVLFDLDGTLIDSVPDIAAATNILLQRHAHDALHVDVVRSFIGNGVRKLVERAFTHSGVSLHSSQLDELNAEMMEIYALNLTKLTVVMADADEILQMLKGQGCKLAIVTNKPEGFTRTIVSHFGWEKLIDMIVGGDTCVTRKPDPEMLFHACRKMQVDVAKSVFVGDSPADIDAAKNAKMRNIVIRGGYTNVPVEELGANTILDQLSQLGHEWTFELKSKAR